MPGFDGTGPNGMGPMTGGGRGLCRSGGAGVRRHAFPRRAPYAYPGYETYGFSPFASRISQEKDFELLNEQMGALKDGLKRLEAEIEKLSTGRSKE